MTMPMYLTLGWLIYMVIGFVVLTIAFSTHPDFLTKPDGTPDYPIAWMTVFLWVFVVVYYMFLSVTKMMSFIFCKIQEWSFVSRDYINDGFNALIDGSRALSKKVFGRAQHKQKYDVPIVSTPAPSEPLKAGEVTHCLLDHEHTEDCPGAQPIPACSAVHDHTDNCQRQLWWVPSETKREWIYYD